MACEQDLALRHFDIGRGFEQSELEKEVFMLLPPGCHTLSPEIAKLHRSLYDSKQASRQWHSRSANCLKDLGFEQCSANSCAFRVLEDSTATITIVVYVDDTFAVGDKDKCDESGFELNKMLLVKNLGDLR